MPGADFGAFLRALVAEYPFLKAATAQRYARLYGTRVRDLLKDVRAPADLGECVGADLYQREIDFLRATEWARTADDIMWRRSKLGLALTDEQRRRLAQRLGA
jgi:glycerol-3-phosphate dehydrogenase